MMPNENLGLLEAARAIVAGRRVDWAAIESSADLTDSSAGLLRQLKVLERVAKVHRSLSDPQASNRSPISSDDAAAVGADLPATPLIWGPLRRLARVGQGAFGDV